MSKPLLGCLCLALLGGAPLAAEEPVATSRHYVFHSDEWMNLHHFLYAWATQEKSAEVPYPHERPMADRAYPPEISAAERATWEEALAYYRRHFGARQLVFDDFLIAAKRRHWDPGYVAPENFSPDLAALEEVLARARPVYEKYWWPAHDRGNRAWLATILPVLSRTEDPMIADLERIYGGRWPRGPVRIDLTAHTDYYGAYNTGEPHVVIATAMDKNAFPQGLEIVFHESSHSAGMDNAIRGGITTAAAARQVRAPRDLWHALIFFTTGELTRRLLAAEGIVDYVPYARREGLYRPDSPWQRYEQLLERHWRPAMEGSAADRVAALGAMVEENARLAVKR
jgi:hypothetical protein